jgi:hypothetical protein
MKQEARPSDGLESPGFSRGEEVNTERAVEKHIRSIFTKLNLLPDTHEHRRVLAVLQYLRASSRQP